MNRCPALVVPRGLSRLLVRIPGCGRSFAVLVILVVGLSAAQAHGQSRVPVAPNLPSFTPETSAVRAEDRPPPPRRYRVWDDSTVDGAILGLLAGLAAGAMTGATVGGLVGSVFHGLLEEDVAFTDTPAFEFGTLLAVIVAPLAALAGGFLGARADRRN
ncbi:MAG: hypothetical protein AAGF12_19875 [Myxococcota bacterium]